MGGELVQAGNRDRPEISAFFVNTTGTVQLLALDARRNADNTISAAQVSQHTAPSAGSLELVRLPTTHAEGDYVTAATEPLSAALHLRGYRSGDRPY